MRSLILPLLIPLLLLGRPGLAAEQRPDVTARIDVSRAEFETALKIYVQNIPDFKGLWPAVEQQSTKTVYFSGGALRGAIHQVYENIRLHGYKEALLLKPPRANELLLQGWSDLDVIAPANWKNWVQVWLPGWDILSLDFMQNSTSTGGTTLEKVMVNPWEVIDPYDALGDYLDGKLTFSFGQPLNHGEIQGNTRLAQALRYLRIAANLPEVRIPPDSLERLQRIENLEWDNIQRDNTTDYWISKALKKLYLAVKQNPSRFMETLREADLLELLAHHAFELPVEAHHNRLCHELIVPVKIGI